MSQYYHLRHPEQARAKWTVKNHVRRGKLFKPDVCEKCLKRFNRIFIEAHHWSYKKEHHGNPNWLCRWCHKLIHAELSDKWIDMETKPDYGPKKLPPPTEQEIADAMAQVIY